MPRENQSRYAVLGFLSWGPMSGYDVKKLVEASVGNFWSEGYGQIYPILRRLASEGLVARAGTGGDGRPERRAFAITRAAQRELDRWLAEPAAVEVGRIEVLLKLFFSSRLAPAAARQQIEAQRGQLSELLARYEAIEAALLVTYAGHPDLPYWRMTVRYGQHVKRALMEWCDESLAALRPPEVADAARP